MKQVLVRQGQAVVEEVPAPLVEPGTMLVRVDHSCISIGTEMSGVRNSGGDPLWKRALMNPDKVVKAARMVATQGFQRTRDVAMGGNAVGQPTGYSAAGVVIAVGEGIGDIAVGERVACAGAQFAHHAEIVRVPRNLMAPVPDELSMDQACTVTLGAIALQGVRRAKPTLGESFVVIGLGFLGQLTVQMLKANGCRVIGADLDPDRVATALELGMDVALDPADEQSVSRVARLTDGFGADGVIITAATRSSDVVSSAFKMCRKKGRVVLVGDVGLDIKREDIYAKELDFFISTSYGPGRYDASYEEKGFEYPIGYVRWTENRNMAEYLKLLAEGALRIDDLIAKEFPVDKAPEAYEGLKSGAEKSLVVLLHYPERAGDDETMVPNPLAKPGAPGAARIGLIGAGGFAKGMHLPNIKALPEQLKLQAVASRTGQNATATARDWSAAYATTDYAKVLSDPDVDAVLIATRHDLHADLVLRALEQGKHVLVEKPLTLSREELDQVTAFFRQAEAEGSATAPVLLTGFNRRFSPFALRLKELTEGRSDPMMLVYRMNAGYIPLDHWVHGPEGGGRNVGEACHIYDLFTYLVDARVTGACARAITPTTRSYVRNDNFCAEFTFEDGSVATLAYTALGTSDYPKEQMEVFCDGRVFVLDDYKALRVWGSPEAGIEARDQDKGQKTEIAEFARAIQRGGEWPIPLWQQVQAMSMAFDVEAALRGGA